MKKIFLSIGLISSLVFAEYNDDCVSKYNDKGFISSLGNLFSGKPECELAIKDLTDKIVILDYKPMSELKTKEEIKKVSKNDNTENVKEIIVTEGKENINLKILDMKSIYFDFDKSNIKNTKLLDEISNLDLNNYKLIVAGYADKKGSVDYNIELSKKRASNVSYYLIKKGISQDLIKTEWYGNTKQVCNESTSECFEKNRRVDIKLYK